MLADKFLCLLLGYKVQLVSYINKISGCGITLLEVTKDLLNQIKIKDLILEAINGVLTLINLKDRVSIKEEINGEMLSLLIQIRVNGVIIFLLILIRVVVNGDLIFPQIQTKEVNGEILSPLTPTKVVNGETLFPLTPTKVVNGDLIFLPIQIRAEINGEVITGKVETNGEIKEEINGGTKVLSGELTDWFQCQPGAILTILWSLQSCSKWAAKNATEVDAW
jgi:hypothetical protein